MRPYYCAGAFLFYGHESDAFRRPVFTWYELSKINAHAEYTTKKSPANLAIYRTLLRRERDSNPRYLSVRRFSRPVHSTTLPSLHGV